MTASVRILQITDTHLLGDPAAKLRGRVNPLHSLEHVLRLGLAREEFDALLCTGDIVNDEPAGYQHFARALNGINKPVMCIPGNHDVPEVMHARLGPLGYATGGYRDFGDWRIVLLDSSVTDSACGHISPVQLQLLRAAAASTGAHVLVALHHHPVAMHSEWLDTVGVDNADEFMAVVASLPNVRTVVWGHVHQTYDAMHGAVRMLGTPSTCVQFRPYARTFEIDGNPPACRMLRLQANGEVETEIVWDSSALTALSA